jgi:hypothetical protein
LGPRRVPLNAHGKESELKKRKNDDDLSSTQKKK